MPKNYLLEPVPNAEAIEFVKGKRPLRREVFEGLLPELRGYAFTVSGLDDARALAEVRDLVAGVPAGEDYRETVGKVRDSLAKHLPLDPDLFDDAAAAAKALAKLEKKAEFVVRNHAFAGYAVGAFKELDDFRDIFTHWKYLTVGDHRVRDSHKALNNLVLPQGHPFWRTHFPPWGHGCRCLVLGLTPEDYDDELAADRAKPTEERTVLEGVDLERLEKEHVLLRDVGRGVERINVQAARERNEPGAWRFEPGDLRRSFADLTAHYSAEELRIFEGWARRADAGEGVTVWEWLRGIGG